MNESIASALRKGAPFNITVTALRGVQEAGRALTVRVEDRALSYVDHVVDGWVDGPPTSNVAFVLSGKDPAAEKWRRFTITKVEPWTYELGVFPTPFPNSQDPLAPGVPPSSSRRR